MELGSGEILLILIVALLVYGGRLPDVARAVGHSFGELKRGLSETKDAVASQLDTGPPEESAAPRRDVVRIHPAHEDLAKEDISSPADGTPSPRGAAEGGPGGQGGQGGQGEAVKPGEPDDRGDRGGPTSA